MRTDKVFIVFVFIVFVYMEATGGLSECRSVE